MDKNYIKEILTKDIQSLGCDLWGIEFFGKNNNQTLRIYIDKKKGISIEDCEKVSKHVIKLLDVENDFSSRYLLEISSPGIERKFFYQEQYKDYLGCLLKVSYLNGKNSKVTKKGTLKEVMELFLLLETKDEIIKISFSSIIQANLLM